MDFLEILETSNKKDGYIIKPNFVYVYSGSNCLLTKGGAFYAIWDEEQQLWSTDILRAAELIDRKLIEAAECKSLETEQKVTPMLLKYDATKCWKDFIEYLKRTPSSSATLNSKIIFSNTETTKEDYASCRLDYALKEGSISAYNRLIDVLYLPEEREKIEWAIGAIVSGYSRSLQKFLVLYGEAGAGKSTMLNIIDSMFHPYTVSFDAKSLASSNIGFSMETFRSNPLIAIQHDGDLSRIESNAHLNSIVSHEQMVMNEKYKSSYNFTPQAFLFMGTNKPVKITDAKSGILRRLIDVHPSGNKVSYDEYQSLMKRISFEKGAIAYHCLRVFEDLGPSYYDKYQPFTMLEETNHVYSFLDENYFEFKRMSDEGGVPYSKIWEMYTAYCKDSLVNYPLGKGQLKSELNSYFDPPRKKDERTWLGKKQYRNVYKNFRYKKFGYEAPSVEEDDEEPYEPMKLELKQTTSEVDIMLADCPAQYASDKETPLQKWENVTTTLKELDTTKLHYILFPEDMKNHIVIDFDLKDKDGNKSADLNLEEAAKWPATYAEFSKGGAGVHLHYIYDGDVSKLSALYSTGIEIKVFNGKSSLRRKLSYCNDLPVAHISSGLPMKEARKVVSMSRIASEKGLRKMIERNLNKEIVPATKPSIDFIYKDLQRAYEDGMIYDVRDMRPRILAFANNSTHQNDYCVKLVAKMKFCSDKLPEDIGNYEEDKPIVFFDIEVFPNLLIVCWKIQGEGHEVVRMINPSPFEVEKLFDMKLVGFNNRRYDNHILYAASLGKSNYELYQISQRLITNSQNATFKEAYNLSYADIYEFSSKKQSLKKFEIELGLHHLENSYPWDEPLAEEHWGEVADYCCNDVIATEATFNDRYSDFLAHVMLAELTGMTVNSNGNTMAARLIFGKERNPELVYVDLATGEASNPKYQRTDIVTAFPGYEFTFNPETKKPVNMYRGTDVGFGGYVYAEPGMWTDVALIDVTSMHPHSIIAMNYLGAFTQTFQDLVNTRIHIKHEDYEAIKDLFEGRLTKYLEDESKIGNLAYSLKIVINKIYGLTSAKFENEFRDNRNKNNIVALRGALFMRTLQDEVAKRGFKVAHIKTDSIKIPNATKEIIDFCMDFAKKYGYSFDHEATYDRMCLVNNAVYIAKYASSDKCQRLYGYVPGDNVKAENKGKLWTPTGAQFAHPYVFKTLFSHEKIEFKDLCEIKEVQGSMSLDYNEGLPNVIALEVELAKRKKGKAKVNSPYANLSDEEIISEIAKGHDYKFIGRIGQFVPVQDGYGGAELMAKRDPSYAAVTGTKGYRWLESEVVKGSELEDKVDLRYYRALVDDAIDNIRKFGDFEWFVSDDDPPSETNHPMDVNDVPWLMPCKDPTKSVCEECELYPDKCKYLEMEKERIA